MAKTKYTEDTAQEAEMLCKLGYTDADLAKHFGVSESTINQWKLVHSEFSESLKDGKSRADANVAQALYLRATGYSHEDVDIRVIDGRIVKTYITKHYPPDPTSMIFWLKNRQSKLWRDKPIETGEEGEQPQPTQVTINTIDASKKKDNAND